MLFNSKRAVGKYNFHTALFYIIVAVLVSVLTTAFLTVYFVDYFVIVAFVF